MVKTNLPNFLFSFKTIQKLTLRLLYMTLLVSSLQASDNLNDFANHVKGYVTHNIILPSTNLLHDISRRVERALRPNPSNLIDQQLQNYFDLFEDIFDKIAKDQNNS